MFNLILFGAPGSGKGTQSEKLIAHYNLVHLSTGDMLREEIAKKSRLGLLTQEIIARGELVSDEIVISMIENKIKTLEEGKKGFIFDGFPRTLHQAMALDSLLEQYDEKVSIAVFLEVPEDELFKRLKHRAQTSNRPDDGNDEIIHRRIVEYKEKTHPLKHYYTECEKLAHIFGVGSIDEIFEKICHKIDFRKHG